MKDEPVACPVCNAETLDCPEHPDIETWPCVNGWSIRQGQTYQGVHYWYLEGPKRVSYQAAADALRRVKLEGT